METANYIDIGLAAVILLLALTGMRNGLIHELSSTIGIILGAYVGANNCIQLGEWLRVAGLSFQNESILWVVAFIAICGVIWIGMLAIGAIIAIYIAKIPQLATINYGGGYISSILKWFVILSLIAYLVSQVEFINPSIKQSIENTKIYPIAYEVAEKIINLKKVQKNIMKLKEERQKTEKKQSNLHLPAKSQ